MFSYNWFTEPDNYFLVETEPAVKIPPVLNQSEINSTSNFKDLTSLLSSQNRTFALIGVVIIIILLLK